jgi:hypothetical protein
MVFAIVIVALAMVAAGVGAIVTGAEIIVLERGWSSVIAGSIVATGGTLLVGIALLVRELRRLPAAMDTVRAGLVPAAPQTTPDVAAGAVAAPVATAAAAAAAVGAAVVAADVASDLAAAPHGEPESEAERDVAAAAPPVFGPAAPAEAPIQAAAAVPSAGPFPPALPGVSDLFARPRSDEAAWRGEPRIDVPAAAAEHESRPAAAAGNVAPIIPPPGRDDVPEPPEPSSGRTMAEARPSSGAPPTRMEPRFPDFSRRDTDDKLLEPAEPPPIEPLPAHPAHPENEEVRPSRSWPGTDPRPSPAIVNEATASPKPASATAAGTDRRPGVRPEDGEAGASKTDVLMTGVSKTDELTPAEIGPHEIEPPKMEPREAEPDEREPEEAEADRSDRGEAEAGEPQIIGTYSSGDNLYVMFSDGSIAAETPDGVFRFESLEDLKEYIAAAGVTSADDRPASASVT